MTEKINDISGKSAGGGNGQERQKKEEETEIQQLINSVKSKDGLKIQEISESKKLSKEQFHGAIEQAYFELLMEQKFEEASSVRSSWSKEIQGDEKKVDKIDEIAKKVIIFHLKRGSKGLAEETIRVCYFPDHLLKSVEVQDAAKLGILGLLERDNLRTVLSIKEMCKLPIEVLRSPEIQNAFKKKAIEYLGEEEKRASWIPLLLKAAEPTDEVLKSPEIQEAARQGIKKILNRFPLNPSYREKSERQRECWIAINLALQIATQFKLSEEEKTVIRDLNNMQR